MDAYKAILGRRSIRRYSDKPVTDEQVRRLLEAGMAAPSAHNRQPWHFIVVRDKATLLEIPKFHQYSKMLEGASAAIIVCAEHALTDGSTFWIQDCSAATENILLSATAEGLGAVWLGVYPQDALVKSMRSLLKIPEEVTPLNIISVGVPAEEKPPANRFSEARIHREKW